jgi:peroxiredoxin
MKVLFSVIIVAAIAICGGCKKQPAEPNQPQGRTPAAPPGPKPVVIDQTGPKKSLDEIIRQAQTWSPAFKPWIGKPAPDFTLTDITGVEHKLSDYRGKHVIINFWATYCGACRLEIPHFIQLRNTVGADKLAIFAISNETAELVKRFAAQQKINYTVIAAPGPMPGPFDAIEYTPTNFFIDPQGIIKLAAVGMMNLDEAKAILQAP